MSDEAKQSPETASQRKRSPAYPAAGLETCVKWARRVWESEKKSSTGALVVAKAMGYSSLSGASRVGISSMKKFGLLVEEGADRVRLSDDAVKLFLLPDETARLTLLRALARKPSIIQELLSEHPEGLPSDDTLRYKLIYSRDFNDEAAETFIKAFRETVRFAQLDPEHYSDLAMTPAPSAVESEVPARNAAPSHSPGQPARENRPRPVDDAPFRVELSDGVRVSLETTGDLTADTFDELLDYLSVYRKVLSRKKRPASPQGSSEG